MTKFLAVHPLSAPATVEEATPLGKKAKANATVDAYWVRSWCQLNKEGARSLSKDFNLDWFKQ